MSTNFSGITFANQNATPSDDGIIRRAMLGDGTLTGCALSYTGSTLTMQPGQLMVCGRQIRHPSVQNWPVVDATSGFARVVLTIDLTKTSTKETFEQVDTSVEYAAAESGFTSLIQQDINASGTMYQVVLAVVSLSAGGISGITYRIPESGTGVGSSKSSIIVTAPTGSTVYIENQDGKRKDTGEKNGVWTFKGCDIGTWTVYARLGDQSSTATVEITEEGQMMRYYVTIAYLLYLYNHGDECIDISGGWTLRQGPNDSTSGYINTATLTKNANSISITTPAASCGQANANNKIDLTHYSTLNVTALTSHSGTGQHISVRSTNVAYDKNFAADLNFSGNGLKTLDISALTGSYYIAIYLTNVADQQSKTFSIYEVYLA